MIEKGADKEARQKDERPVLGQAVRTGQVEMVKVLVNAKVDLNKADCDQYTPLHLATMNGKFDCAKVLVEGGADKTIKNNQGKTPLQIAKGPGDWKSLLS